ncbi:hypothetical protein Tcan_05562 [Toxocara canis]|uniref:RYYR-CCHC domain-containing protein n=1 Tax=Toxocara canis TaxID=6265 RepID=A0A0B2UZX3_TOXCA|nr:hypothetical protein Tcan_05562 [Toxocara canis]
MTEETASCSHRRKGDSREKSIPTMNSADELTHIHPRQTTVSPETMDDGAARNQASSRSHSDGISQKSHPRVNWNNAELKRILSDYRERGIGSTRQVAQQISALTGIYVSHSTICRQSRSQTGCNEWVPRQSLADTGVGIAAYRERSFKEDEENEGDASTSTRHSWSVSDQGAEMRMPIKHSKNGPLRTPPTVPYYMSFSERFKQTSLTVHLNADEVRIYRHTSHSRDCRSIYFRCSRCDNINRKLRTGITPRIKMMDGVVVGDLFPEHHPRCIPMSIVAARALEIERRCRKDIINGMDPKEAWQKGRLAAIAESATLGSSVYGPGTVTAAFPDWERCRRLYCTLRGKTLRRRLKNELFDPKRIVLNDPDRPNSHAPRNGVDEISQFDVSEPPRPKRPSFEHQCEWNAEAIHDRGNTHDEEDCMAVEDEVLDEELDESYMNEFAESDDEIYGEIVGEKIDDQFVVEREEIVTSSSLRTDHVKTNVYSNVSSPQPHAGQVVMDMNEKDLQTSKRRQNEHAACSQTSDSVPSTSSNASAVRGADDRRRKTMSTHVQQVRYEETPPMYETRRKETSEFVSEDGRPRRLIRPARKLSPMPTASASAHAALPPTLKRSTTPILQRKLIREADTGESREANSCVRVITPAGMIPMNIKREEKFAHGEAAEKLRQIERLIAEYNLRSGDKLASVLVRRNGHMKMFGSKALIAASLHSPFYQSLRNAANSKRFFEADEMISLPLIKVRTASEVDVMHDAMMRPMLSDFITQSHFPTVHSFDAIRVPDYWPDDMISLPLIKVRTASEVDVMHDAMMRPMLSDFITQSHFPTVHSFDAIRVPDYWPDDVFYCDPDREHANFINAAKRQQFRSFNSVVDGQRHVLKYAYQSYSDFLMSHFDAACIPG